MTDAMVTATARKIQGAPTILVVACLVLGVGCRTEKEPSDEESLPLETGIPDEPIDPEHEAPLDEPVKEPPAPPVRSADQFQAGRTATTQYVRSFADAFEGLDSKKRVLTYHLARAVLAGRDIAFEQVHKDGLEIRSFIECVLQHTVGTNVDIESSLSAYLQDLWIHGGNYDRVTGKKLVPRFDFEQLSRAAQNANAAGGDLNLAKGESLAAKLARLKRPIFDAEYHPILASANPLHGMDMLQGSFLNIYSDVTMRDLKGFEEHYPVNSRLSRIDRKLVEEVYRAGDKRRKIPPGLYSQELRRVTRRLHDAMASAKREQRVILVNLVEYFRTGDQGSFEEVRRAWLARAFDVEFLLGFTDTGLDPRGTKGIFTGLVGFLDRPNTSRLDFLARNIQDFEDMMPWETKYRRDHDKPPVVAAVQLMATAGRICPACPFGHTLMDEPAVLDAERKILLFTNILETYRQAVATRIVDVLVDPRLREQVRGNLDPVLFLRIASREVLGRNLGKTEAMARRQLKNTFPVMQELKAELVSLWLLADPKLTELGLLSSGKTPSAVYRFVTAESLLEQAVFPEKILREPGMLARRILIRYLAEKAKVLTFEKMEDKTFPVISDDESFRKALGQLLVQTERILATANRRSALRLMDAFGEPASWPFLEEVRARVRDAGLRRTVAFIMPKLTPHRDGVGRVTQVTLSHEESFERQMMRYRRY